MKQPMELWRGQLKHQWREDGEDEQGLIQLIDSLSDAQVLEQLGKTAEDVLQPTHEEVTKSRADKSKQIEQQQLMSGQLTGRNRLAAIMARQV